MTDSVTTAVILAAGMGMRLRDVHNGSPKGLLRIHGETLIERSIRLLRRFGMRRIVLVTGYEARDYAAATARAPDIELVHNAHYADTGSMASLSRALELVVDEDFLLLESDLFYEARALDQLVQHGASDVVLLSGPTNAGDEVWVQTAHGRLEAMSKDRADLESVTGEFVGICRVSGALAGELRREFADFVRANGHGRMSYETDAMVNAARRHEIAVHLEPTLLWGEIDDPGHYARVRDLVAPRVARLQDFGSGLGRREVLLNPGPATTTLSVKRALVMPDVCPREESFTSLLRSVMARLASLAGEGAVAIPIVGSGTAALEATLGSVVPHDRTLLVIDNGDYGARLAKIAARLGVVHEVLELGWGRVIEPDVVSAALARLGGQVSHLAMVHHETSTGMLNPLDAVGELCRTRGVSLILDAMSSFAAIPIDLETHGVDYLVSSANKCVQGMAGLAFVIARAEALDRARAVEARGFYLDLVAQLDNVLATGQTRFTVPPQIVSALDRALRELEIETVEGRRARYDASHRALVEGLEGLGFELLLPEAQRSRILLAVREPEEDWYEFSAMHDALLAQGFTIYPGKPSRAPCFRLSVLGAIDGHDIRDFLRALGSFLAKRRPRTPELVQTLGKGGGDGRG